MSKEEKMHTWDSEFDLLSSLTEFHRACPSRTPDALVKHYTSAMNDRGDFCNWLAKSLFHYCKHQALNDPKSLIKALKNCQTSDESATKPDDLDILYDDVMENVISFVSKDDNISIQKVSHRFLGLARHMGFNNENTLNIETPSMSDFPSNVQLYPWRNVTKLRVAHNATWDGLGYRGSKTPFGRGIKPVYLAANTHWMIMIL